MSTREDALLKAAKELDISPSKYKQAQKRFNAVKSHLEEGEYKNSNGRPEVYLQGSFRLGTEIKPYSESNNADYDIDIVCRLKQHKNDSEAGDIKADVGDRLKQNGHYKRILDNEGKRCWTLLYSEQDGYGFHIDVLPCVNEYLGSEGRLSLRDQIILNEVSQRTGNSKEYYSHSISATNKDEDGDYSWTTSNPKGFAQWFFEKNKQQFNSIKVNRKQALFENYRDEGLFESWDEVPDIHVKTVLQRTIQLLKRHRDVRFSGLDSESHKPISIIITTLATRAYNSEETISESLSNIIRKLKYQLSSQLGGSFVFNEAVAHDEYDLIRRTKDGWYIGNPSNPDENFADRWHEDNNARAKAFFKWLEWAERDLILETKLEEDTFIEKLFPSKTSPQFPKIANFDLYPAHREMPSWDDRLESHVNLIAKYKSDMGGYQQFNSLEEIEKGLTLRFEAETDVEGLFQVHWQVVNTGQEAGNDLRGTILPSPQAGRGGLVLSRDEITKYKGIHWVQCFIVKGNTCVAKSDEFFVNIK